MWFKYGVSVVLFVCCLPSNAQKDEAWFNKDYERDGILGISVNRSFETFKDRKSESVVVAIIDSGVDIDHQDIKKNLWVNLNEIPDNGIDDDGNGYVDDIHGWNFLGGSDGQNIITETYGEVRHYRALRDSLANKDTLNLSPKDSKYFSELKSTRKSITNKFENSRKELAALADFDETLSRVKFLLQPYVAGETLTEELIKSIESSDERVLAAKGIMQQLLANGFREKEYEDYKEYHRVRSSFHYNIDYDPRPIVGDDPNDPFERFYGNNDVHGEGHAAHGTHVAGIIGASRDDIGMSGIARDVKLMILRAVPDGDERDKDIANAILYAVENGAKVINMSFGKGHSPHKKAVDRAVKYAESQDVLIVHAAGNAAVNIDEAIHYPIRTFETGLVAKNWIEVGASDRLPNEYLLADFTNYGKREVDLFAPGVDIYSTEPGNQYAENSGTSMAAPVVSGLAAVVWSYFPELSCLELKEIILKSAMPLGNLKVLYPNTGERTKKAKLKKLSATGGIANLYRALQMADTKF